MRTKQVSCLVLDSSSETGITLKRGENSSFQSPDWRCDILSCPIRGREKPGEIGLAYKKLHVRLGSYKGKHGVIKCEGGGSVERSH